MQTILRLLVALIAPLLIASGPGVYRITTVVGGGRTTGDSPEGVRNNNRPQSDSLEKPSAVIVDSMRNLWVAEEDSSRIRVISPTGMISMFEGGDAQHPERSVLTRLFGSQPSNRFSQNAAIYKDRRVNSLGPIPVGQAAKRSGEYLFADTTNHRIQSVSANGVVATIVGTGVAGFNGDQLSTATQVDRPSALALDGNGNLYFADTGNDRIRKLTSDGNVVTLETGLLSHPQGLTCDDLGNLFISDTGNDRIVMLSVEGKSFVIAGNRFPGFNGDRDLATEAQLSAPKGLFFDRISGSIYVADSGNNLIRRLSPETNISDPNVNVVNAATWVPGPVAVCSSIVVFAPDVGISGTRVLFDGHPALIQAPLTNQITTQLPCDTEDRNSVELSIVYDVSPPIRATLSLARVAPGLFTVAGGTGQVLATNADGSVNSETHPAIAGSIVSFWATGLGQSKSLRVMLGSNTSKVLTSQEAPGLPGVAQIDVQTPADLVGRQNVVLVADDSNSQAGVTVEFGQGAVQPKSSNVSHTAISSVASTKTFAVTTSLGNLVLTQGSKTAFTVSVVASNGYTGIVTPTIVGVLPAGVTASATSSVPRASACSPAAITTSGSCVITLTASTAAAAGPASIIISATDGSTVHTATISVTVVGFSISTAATSLQLAQGGSVTLPVTVTSTPGYLGTVTPTIAGTLPAGVTASACSPAAITTSGSCVITLTASSTAAAAGPANLTLSATDRSAVHTATTSVTVVGFSISTAATSLQLAQGGSVTLPVTVTSTPGYLGTVTPTIAGTLPAGVTASACSPAAITTSGSCVITLTASSTAAAAGPANLTLSATDRSAVHTATTSVTVVGFSISTAATSLQLAQGGSVTLPVTVTSTPGYLGTVTPTIAGTLPAGVTASACSPAAITTSGSCVITLTASSTAAAAGPANLTLSATDRSAVHTATTSVTVVGFSISTAATSLQLAQGGSVTLPVTVTSTPGYLGTVTPTIAGTLPAGVTASACSPAAITTSGSCVITLTASSTAAAAGPANLTLSATDRSAVHTATTSVTVVGFSISTAATSLQLAQGGSVTLPVTVTSTPGYLGTVTPTIAGTLPAGVTASACSPAAITTSGSCVITLTASSTAAAAGPANLTLSATDRSAVHTATTSVTVVGFSISTAATSLQLAQGGSVTLPVTVTSTPGYLGTVTPTIAGTLPAGVTASACSPAAITTSGSCVITLTASSTAATAGPANLTLSATDTITTHIGSTMLLVLPLHAATVPSMNVTISSLAATTGGTTVNLSSATADWRLFAGGCYRASGVASSGTVGGCYADRAIGGSGILGVYNLTTGQDPNFYPYGPPVPALVATYTDGTISRSGALSGNTNFFVGSKYAVGAVADNSVTKTFTTYWRVANNYTGGPTFSGNDSIVFTFGLSDNSIAPQTKTIAVTSAAQNGLIQVTVVYAAASDGQELIVTAAKATNTDGNTYIQPLLAMLTSAPTGPTVRAIPLGSELQGELDSARPGDTLVFPATYTATGNYSLVHRPVILGPDGAPYKVNVRAANVNLTSSVAPSTIGQRIMLSEATVTWTSPNPDPVLTGVGSAIAHWSFDGIRFASLSSDPWGLVYALVSFDLGYVPDHTTTIANLPSDISFTHVVIHGRDAALNEDGSINFLYRQKAGLRMNLLNGFVADSNITNWVAPQYPNSLQSNNPAACIANFCGGQEANAFLTQIGKNIQLMNNELSSQGEVVMMNVGDIGMSASEANNVAIPGGLMPDGITIGPGNHIYKQSAWVNLEYTKNLIECKTCRNTHIYGNLVEFSFEGTYSDGQHGASIVAQNRNGFFNYGWAWTHDVEIDHNIQRHQGACFQTAGGYDDKWLDTADGGPGQAALSTAIARGMGRESNINYHDNYCADTSEVWTTPSSAYPTIYATQQSGSYPAMGLRGGAPDYFTVQRNTMLFREAPNVLVPAATLYGVTYNAYTPNSTADASTFLPSDANSTGTTNVAQVYDSNIFGWGETGCNSSWNFGCFPGNDPAHTQWTNNAMQNVVQSPGSWKSFFASQNSTYPGKWAGNAVSGDGSASVTGAGAPSSVLAGEAAIRAGGR